MKPEIREALGKSVRGEWVAWAKEQENAKPSWLVPWEGLNEADKEADRRIAEAAVKAFLSMLLPVFVGTILSPDDIRDMMKMFAEE